MDESYINLESVFTSYNYGTQNTKEQIIKLLRTGRNSKKSKSSKPNFDLINTVGLLLN